MNQNDRPSLVPTLATTSALIWSLVLVGAFLAALASYTAIDHLLDVLRIHETAHPTSVKTAFYETEIPAGWAYYTLDGNDLRMYKDVFQREPLVCYSVRQDPSFRYRALDLNPALTARRLTDHLVALGLSTESNETARVIATDVVQVDPNVSAVRAQFECGRLAGESLYFILDDVAYQVTGLWDWGDRASAREIRRRLEYMFDMDKLLDWKSSYARPVIDSARLSAEEHQRVHELAGNERAMWELFATRSETEPESVLAAIVHFRKLILLLASIREERELCESAAYERYERLLEARKAERTSWLLLLDKYRSLGDLPRAIQQADHIARHAVLDDEALLRQSALRVKRELEAQKAQKEGAQ